MAILRKARKNNRGAVPKIIENGGVSVSFINLEPYVDSFRIHIGDHYIVMTRKETDLLFNDLCVNLNNPEFK